MTAAGPAAGVPADVVARLAGRGRLLVATDFDGTLSPLVDDPSAARALPAAVDALAALSRLAGTEVAVVSGRSLAELAVLTRLPASVVLVGSHGAEADLGFLERLDPAVLELLARLRHAVGVLVDQVPGARAEHKPASVALHVRGLDHEVGADALAAAAEGPGRWEGVVVRHGKDVVELGVVATTKGDAVEHLRLAGGAEAVLFLGDDVTDEDVFARLGPGDVGVKVGPGATQARWRVADPQDVADVLARLAEARRDAVGAS